MNIREIEHLWKVASNNPNHDTNWHDPVIVKFADLVIATEREACAKVCEQEVCACCWEDDAQAAAEHLAERIRARGQK